MLFKIKFSPTEASFRNMIILGKPYLLKVGEKKFSYNSILSITITKFYPK